MAPLWTTNDATATSMKLAMRRRKSVHKAFNELLLPAENSLKAVRFPLCAGIPPAQTWRLSGTPRTRQDQSLRRG
jgi:hypothetical protein